MSFRDTEQNTGEGLSQREASHPQNRGPGPNSNHGIPPQLQLSVQDQIFMKKMRTEAAITRGYPLALVSMGLTILGIGRFYPKMQRWQKFLIAGSVGIVGNITGKASYVPIMIKRIKTDLPPDSNLRQLVEAKANGQSWKSLFEKNCEEQNNQEMQFGLEEDSKQDKRFVSYDELRKKNRQMDKPEWHGRFSQSKSQSGSNIEQNADKFEDSSMNSYPAKQAEPDLQQSGKVRYNKYGDQIID
uniref:OCIA domain-containing protein 1-like n=1 Tax=Phallusia mammillata TaxID=59560 RepID=A0A6F9DNH2_9ASCI|nr:OCIA domain-containing protein 1-like [Phallusia mammillata]